MSYVIRTIIDSFLTRKLIEKTKFKLFNVWKTVLFLVKSYVKNQLHWTRSVSKHRLARLMSKIWFVALYVNPYRCPNVTLILQVRAIGALWTPNGICVRKEKDSHPSTSIQKSYYLIRIYNLSTWTNTKWVKFKYLEKIR